jgi:hypothetical protein
VAHIAEHVVVDHEIVDQAFEQRVVEDEQSFRQIAHRALLYDGIVEMPEYGEQRIRVVAIAVPDVRKRVAGWAQLARLVGPEFAVGWGAARIVETPG